MEMKRTVFLFGIILIIILVFGIYILIGCSDRHLKAEYDVSIYNPLKNELWVKMTVFPTGKPLLHLFFA